MYLTCFKDSLPILSDSYQVIFASKLSYGCWHKPLPYGFMAAFVPQGTLVPGRRLRASGDRPLRIFRHDSFHIRVHVHHDVLDAGEVPLDAVVDLLGDIVGLDKGHAAVKGDLKVHIDAAAELPGLEPVDAPHLGLEAHAVGKALLGLRVAGVVHHLVGGVVKDVIGGLEDEKADHKARDGLHHRIAEASPGYADEGADGGEGVAPVVPGVRHQGGRVVAFGIEACVPVHGLLRGDGQHRGEEREKPRRRLRSAPRADGLDRPVPDEDAGRGEDHRENDRRDALKAFMPVGVLPVGGLDGELHADDDDKARKHIRGGVDRVRDHGPRVGQDAREQLEKRQGRVPRHAHERDARSAALKFRLRIHAIPSLQNSLLYSMRGRGFFSTGGASNLCRRPAPPQEGIPAGRQKRPRRSAA